MWLCELYKDQDITIKINKNVYHGPIKRIYQTFYDKWIEVPFNGKWFSVKIIGEASEKDIYNYNGQLMCSLEFVKNYYRNIYMKNGVPLPIDDPYYIPVPVKTDLVGDWLFGIEFKEPKNQFYELTGGIIIPAR